MFICKIVSAVYRHNIEFESKMLLGISRSLHDLPPSGMIGSGNRP